MSLRIAVPESVQYDKAIVTDGASIVLFSSLFILFLLFLMPAFNLIRSTKKNDREMVYDDMSYKLHEDKYI